MCFHMGTQGDASLCPGLICWAPSGLRGEKTLCNRIRANCGVRKQAGSNGGAKKSVTPDRDHVAVCFDDVPIASFIDK